MLRVEGLGTKFNFSAPVNNVAASNVITHGANVISSSADTSAGSLKDAIDRLALEVTLTGRGLPRSRGFKAGVRAGG